MSMRFLVAESEPPETPEKRGQSVGRSLGETYVDMLRKLVPGASCHWVKPADADADGDANDILSFVRLFETAIRARG
jgi:GMP synthase (glutamine-hydrolysing)